VTDHPADRDITRTGTLINDLLGGLLDQAWTATTDRLTARQQTDTDGSSGGKPGSRPPMRLDMLAHVQTTLDEARTLCCDELGTYLANDRCEEALRRTALPRVARGHRQAKPRTGELPSRTRARPTRPRTPRMRLPASDGGPHHRPAALHVADGVGVAGTAA
jgi:hypothetical protein